MIEQPHPDLEASSSTATLEPPGHHDILTRRDQRRAFPLIDFIACEIQEEQGLDGPSAVLAAIQLLEEASATVARTQTRTN